MKHPLVIHAAKALAATVLVLGAPLALAHGQPDVRWSVSIGSPYYSAPQVYSPPPVVYVQPQPVYVRPQPVYVQRAPIVQYGQPYYVEEVRYKRFGHRHWRHHRDHDD
jgi:hypothetical protein